MIRYGDNQSINVEELLDNTPQTIPGIDDEGIIVKDNLVIWVSIPTGKIELIRIDSASEQYDIIPMESIEYSDIVALYRFVGVIE